MESSFTFLRIRGIPIGAHWSWVLVFALIAWSLTGALFPATFPGLSETTYLVMGIFTALLLFVSILLHELGHATQALREGMKIEGITLWLFGGVARFSGMFPNAGAEFRIAVAGPIVSVVLAIFFYLLSLLALPDAAAGVIEYLARINAILVAFNLVPALPLDGGRILRAWLWHRQRNFAAATVSAARAGKLFGGVLAAVGLLNFFTGGHTGGIWFLFLGWFLVQAAQAEAAAALVQRSLGGLRVRDLMTPDPDTTEATNTIERFFDEIVRGRAHSSYPVLDRERVVGLISLRQAGAIPADERSTKRVSEVMVPRDDIAVVGPDQEVIGVLDSIQTSPRRAVVLDDERLEGIFSVSDVARAVEVAEARGAAAERPETRRAGLGVWVVVTALILLAGGALYHPPLVVLEPGPAIEVAGDIQITGADVTPVNGSYVLTSVRLSQPSALRTLWAAMGGAEVFGRDQFVPEGVEPERFEEQQRQLFRQSQEIAAAAGARAAGLEVTVTGTGAEVSEVIPGSPAEGVLEAGDVIVAVDGRPVELATDLSDAVRGRPARTRFQLTVERGGSRSMVEVRSAPLPGTPEGTVGIGVFITTRDFDVRLPFEVDFTERDIGGPSAGLVYALAITDLLDEADHAAGRTIAGTGTIDGEGLVGPVGGVDAKAEGALEADADIFIVPAGELDDVEAEDLVVRGVSTLAEAIRELSGRS